MMLGRFGKGDWVEGEAEILEENVIKDPQPTRTPEGHETDWEDLKKTIDYRLRVSAGTRAPYELELRLKKPNKYSTKSGKIPLLVHPDKPDKVEPLWKELPRTTDVAMDVAKEKIAGFGDRFAEVQGMLSGTAGAGHGAAPAAEQGAAGIGDPTAAAKQALLTSYQHATGPQRELLAAQLRALGVEPPE